MNFVAERGDVMDIIARLVFVCFVEKRRDVFAGTTVGWCGFGF